jgi:hypothetical protein
VLKEIIMMVIKSLLELVKKLYSSIALLEGP